MTLASLDGVNAPHYALILSQLPIVFIPGVFQQVNINEAATLVQEIDPNTLVLSLKNAATLVPFNIAQNITPFLY